MRRSKPTRTLAVDRNGIQDQLSGEPYTVIDAAIARIFSLAPDESILFGSAESYGLKFTRSGTYQAHLLIYKPGEQDSHSDMPLGEAQIKASVALGIVVNRSDRRK